MYLSNIVEALAGVVADAGLGVVNRRKMEGGRETGHIEEGGWREGARACTLATL